MLFCSFYVVFVFGRFSWSVEKNLGIGCGYDLSFGDEYKLFKSSNPVCQTAGKNLFASWLFASNTTVPTGYA